MTTTVTAKIQVRKGTAAQWTSANPTLLSGEIGFETDTGKVKIGDGSTAWTTLTYTVDPAAVHITDHGALTGLADDDHTQYHTDARGDARYALTGHNHSGTYEPADATLLKQADVDDTPVNGVTTAPVSSNWAYDHATLTTAHGISAFGASLADDADAGTARATLGLGTAATQNTTAFEASGTVSTHAALTTTHGISSFGASLVDDTDAGAARTTLGLGTAATSATGDFAAASHAHAASAITSGTIDTARLGSGAASSSTYLRGDQTWAAASGGVASDTHAATDKATPVDADELPLVDSAATFSLKKLTWANLKTTLAGMFAALAGKSGGQTIIGGTGVADKLVLQGTSGNGTSTTTALEFKVGNNGATSALTLLNNGRVGIGVSNPGYALDIYRPDELIQRWSNNNAYSTVYQWRIGNGNLSQGVLYFYAGTEPSTVLSAAVNPSGIWTFSTGLSSPSYRTSVAGRGDCPIITWTNTGGNFNGKLSLYESYPSGDVSIDQWIANDGVWRVCKSSLSSPVYPLVIPGNTLNVGINTSSPATKLHVISTTEQLRLGYDSSNYASFTVDSAGNLTLTNTGTTPSTYIATLRSGRKITAVTTTVSPAATDVGTVYTNEGDTDGATITLPTAAAGLNFIAYVQTAQTLTITANSGDTIRIASNVTAAAGSITSNVVGSSVTLVAINATEWVAIASIGSWSF